MGLAPLMVQKIFETMPRDRPRPGVTTLLVEQNAKARARMCDPAMSWKREITLSDNAQALLRKSHECGARILASKAGPMNKNDTLHYRFSIAWAPRRSRARWRFSTKQDRGDRLKAAK